MAREEMMSHQSAYCQNCGRPLPPDARFCETCGQAVRAVRAPAPTREPVGVPETPTPEAGLAPEKPRRFPWLLGGVILVLLGGLLGGYSWWVTRTGPPPVAGAGPGGNADVYTITDITQWRHPVKDVLQKHKVIIHKVELRRQRTYPIFFVTFPYDPWLKHNNNYFKPLYYETLRANGFWDYAFVDRSSECTITIHWDKQTQTLTEGFDQ